MLAARVLVGRDQLAPSRWTLVPSDAVRSLRLLLYEAWMQDRRCGRDSGGRLCGLGAASAYALGRNR